MNLKPLFIEFNQGALEKPLSWTALQDEMLKRAGEGFVIEYVSACFDPHINRFIYRGTLQPAAATAGLTDV